MFKCKHFEFCIEHAIMYANENNYNEAKASFISNDSHYMFLYV